MIVGIDLGTTYSAVAAMTDGDDPVVLPNVLGERLTPSAVSLDGDAILVGAAARARATTHPELTALSFKRDMGTDRKIRLGERTWTAMELSALVLGSLKRDAEAALGREVRDVVVTVPAYFGELQRQHTRQAAEMAGLRAVRLLNEPTAAALVYGLVARAEAHDVTVLDLGGGTFDVSVLHIEDGDIAVRATAGDVRLGGDDFDAMLLQLVFEREGERLGELDRVTRARLLRACEGAKKRLSEHETAEITLVDAMLARGRGDFATSIDRASADRAFAPLLERMRGPIDRALRDAKTTMSAMDEVILVGGATRMPAVRRLVADLFNRLPLATLPPDLAVAMGAAVQGELLESNRGASDAVLTDVAPFTLGVESTATLGRHRVSGIFAPIISRGTVLPASRTRSFSTIDDLQTSITFTVYQGEHARCPDNALLGTFEVKGLRPRPSGEETVELRFTYDANGLLEIDVVVLSTGATETHLVTSTTSKMSPEETAAAREAMQKVKVRPREEMPNATAIARAEALFVDLVGSERDDLGEALAMFRASLETEDAELINDMRARLVSLITRLH